MLEHYFSNFIQFGQSTTNPELSQPMEPLPCDLHLEEVPGPAKAMIDVVYPMTPGTCHTYGLKLGSGKNSKIFIHKPGILSLGCRAGDEPQAW